MKIYLFTVLSIALFFGCKKDKDNTNNTVETAMAFVVQKNATTANLWYTAADGSSFAQVIADNLGTNMNSPAWSPDGRRIFFIKDSDNKGENGIYAVRPNGEELGTVYKDNDSQLRHYYQLSASDDNENIAFSLDIPRTGRKVIELYTMCPCGDRVVRMTEFETSQATPSSTESYAGSFSPGDTSLVFCQSDPGVQGKKDVKIYKMSITTRNITLLQTIQATNAAACAPSYSPGGERFLLSIDGNIHTMNADGSELKPLSTLKGFRPVWDKNGRDFYFSSYGVPGMQNGIYKANINVTDIKLISRSTAIGTYGAFAVNL